MTIGFPAVYQEIEAIVFNPLWLPGGHPRFMPYTVEGGQQLYAGTVLGRVTATGFLKLSAASAADGSETPIAILPHDIVTYAKDGTTALAKRASVIVAGDYVNETALTWGSGHTLDTVREALRKVGILMRAPGYSG